jgi:hypothetical protein
MFVGMSNRKINDPFLIDYFQLKPAATLNSAPDCWEQLTNLNVYLHKPCFSCRSVSRDAARQIRTDPNCVSRDKERNKNSCHKNIRCETAGFSWVYESNLRWMSLSQWIYECISDAGHGFYTWQIKPYIDRESDAKTYTGVICLEIIFKQLDILISMLVYIYSILFWPKGLAYWPAGKDPASVRRPDGVRHLRVRVCIGVALLTAFAQRKLPTQASALKTRQNV